MNFDLGVNKTINDLAASLTGNNNKAYILLHSSSRNGNDADPAEQLSGLAKGLKASVDGAKAGSSFADFALSGRQMGYTTSAFGGANAELSRRASENDFVPIRVQYNPSTIMINGRGGSIRRQGIGGEEDQYRNIDAPSQLTMRVELWFDDTNVRDAFLMEDLTSVRGIATKTIEKGVNRLRGKEEYSVQDISELFVSAIMTAYTRQIAFVWNKMIFWGELVGVNVQYRMFNKIGNPIRSSVMLEIQQGEKESGDPELEAAWQEAFEKLFD